MKKMTVLKAIIAFQASVITILLLAAGIASYNPGVNTTVYIVYESTDVCSQEQPGNKGPSNRNEILYRMEQISLSEGSTPATPKYSNPRQPLEECDRMDDPRKPL